MDINLSALNAFRNLGIQNEKAILVDMDDKYGSIDTYKGPLSAMKRTEGERLDNNKMREKLLDALANAFGMSDEITVVGGKKQYSSELLNTLEKHLGKEFKRADFGFTKSGTVTSGRPLTMRRVTAILDKLENAKFNISVHEKLLEKARDRLSSFDLDSPKFDIAAKKIHNATQYLQILKNDAKGEPLIFFNVLEEEYSIRDISNENGPLTSASDLEAVKKYITKKLGLEVTLLMAEILKEALTEESVNKLNNRIVESANSHLTALLIEVINM